MLKTLCVYQLGISVGLFAVHFSIIFFVRINLIIINVIYVNVQWLLQCRYINIKSLCSLWPRREEMETKVGHFWSGLYDYTKENHIYAKIWLSFSFQKKFNFKTLIKHHEIIVIWALKFLWRWKNVIVLSNICNGMSILRHPCLNFVTFSPSNIK